MNLAEAVAEFERGFAAISDVAGFQEDDAPRLDMDRAPSGERYVRLTSGGLWGVDEAIRSWHAGEDAAAGAWLRAAWGYADRREGAELFWRDRPVYMEAEFLAVDQAGLMQDFRMRSSIVIHVGFVYSRLVVGKPKQEAGT